MTLTAAFSVTVIGEVLIIVRGILSLHTQNLASNFYAELVEDKQMFPNIFSGSQTLISEFKVGWHLKQLNIFPIFILKKHRDI